MYKYCSYCGHQASQDANFCTKCGTGFEDVTYSFEYQSMNGRNDSEENENGEARTEEQANESTAQFYQDSFSADTIDKITADLKIYSIEVTAADVDEVKISWEKTESWRLTPMMKGRTLHLKENNRIGMHNIHDFFHNSGHNVIRIEVPAAKAIDLELENEVGTITVADIKISAWGELKSSIGKIDVRNVEVPDALTVSTTTGSIRIDNLEAGQTVKLSSQIGKIQADHVKTGTFYTNNTSGKCVLNDILASGQFTVTGGVGEAVLDEITAEKMDIRMNATGNVNCQNLYADSSISIYNTVGNITCGIRDDAANYTTHCHSDQGRNNYPEVSGKGNKRLNVRTTLGSVDIFFTGTKEQAE